MLINPLSIYGWCIHMVNSIKILGIGVVAAIALSIVSMVYVIWAINEIRGDIGRVNTNINSNINSLSERVSQLSRVVEGSATSIGILNRTIGSIEEKVAGINSSVASLSEFLRISTEPKITVKYAKLFQVTYDGPVKVVRDAEGQVMLLIPRSLSPQRNLIEYYTNKYSPQLVIYTPVERVVLMSATQVAMLLRLEQECRVSIINTSLLGIMWGKQYPWYVPRIADMLEKGVLKDFGGADNPNIEAIVASKPDLVVIYTYAGSPVFRSLKSAGLPVVVDNEYLEQTLMGRFEWIKFLALFYNLDNCAESLFNRVENTISSLRSSIANQFPAEGQRPMVAWFSVFGGVIYAASPASYVVDAIIMAGGRYAFSDIPFGRVSREVVIARSSSIDVLIYSSSIDYGPKSLSELLKAVPFVSDMKAVKEGRVYVFAPTYWQLGTAYPEDIVRDLVKIFYPDLQDLKDWKLMYFVKLS